MAKGSPSTQCTESYPDLCLLALALASPTAVGGPRMVRSPVLFHLLSINPFLWPCGRLFLTTSRASKAQILPILTPNESLRRTFQPSDSILPVLPGVLSQSPGKSGHFVSISMACGATPDSALSQSRRCFWAEIGCGNSKSSKVDRFFNLDTVKTGGLWLNRGAGLPILGPAGACPCCGAAAWAESWPLAVVRWLWWPPVSGPWWCWLRVGTAPWWMACTYWTRGHGAESSRGVPLLTWHAM